MQLITRSASYITLKKKKKMVCNGICVRHKATKPNGAGRYASGQKRCQVCEIFINWDANNFCPCCGYRLRGRPRNLKYKEKLRSQLSAIPRAVKQDNNNEKIPALMRLPH
jgi:hypothetical protein